MKTAFFCFSELSSVPPASWPPLCLYLFPDSVICFPLPGYCPAPTFVSGFGICFPSPVIARLVICFPIGYWWLTGPHAARSATHFKNFLHFPVGYAILSLCGHGGIGRRIRFRILRLRRAGSSPVARTIMWRQKRCLLRKARIYRAFLLPKRRFFSVPKHRCKIAIFPLWIDLNSRKVNIRYTGR